MGLFQQFPRLSGINLPLSGISGSEGGELGLELRRSQEMQHRSCQRSQDERAEQNIRPEFDSGAESKEKKPTGTEESPRPVSASEESGARFEELIGVE